MASVAARDRALHGRRVVRSEVVAPGLAADRLGVLDRDWPRQDGETVRGCAAHVDATESQLVVAFIREEGVPAVRSVDREAGVVAAERAAVRARAEVDRPRHAAAVDEGGVRTV